MAEAGLNAQEENDSRTNELMDLLIRDPDSLGKDDLERLCEAISRDALSTKNAIANEQCSGMNMKSSSVMTAPAIKEEQDLKMNDQKVPVPVGLIQNRPAAHAVINMASGDGLPQISYQNRYVGGGTLALHQLPRSAMNIVTSGQSNNSGATNSRNQRHVEDTASNRVFASFAKPDSARTLRQYPIATITGTKGFLVRSANGVTMTCPFERAFQVAQSPTTFYAMPARQMKYTVPCSEQAIATTNWLLENFEENLLSTMPRSAMYQAYVGRFSASEKVKHFNQAVFGKMVRACFPNLTTRRLGVRGQSRYHYSGLAVKPASKYADLLSTHIASVPRIRCQSKKGSRMHMGVAANVTIDSNVSSSENAELKSSWSDESESAGRNIPSYYPSVEELVDVPEEIEFEPWKLFIAFYSDYNGQLFAFMSSLDHEKTKNHMQKFEDLLPAQCVELLQYSLVQDVIRVFDATLYKQASTSLLPHCMATLSTEFKVSLRKFARAFVEWVSPANTVHKVPSDVHKIRLDGASLWADHIKRATTLCHVAKEARKSLKDNAVTKQLRVDLEAIALEDIGLLSSWCGGGDAPQVSAEREVATALQYMNTILAMLKGRSRLDEYVSLVDKIVQEQLFRNGRDSSAEKQFLMKWSMYSSKILTEITLKSSASVGTFHLLSLLFGDYINYLIRSKHETDELRRVTARVLKDVPNQNQHA